jgi:hypothetical protein
MLLLGEVAEAARRRLTSASVRFLNIVERSPDIIFNLHMICYGQTESLSI